jgi:hypothetical protein
MSLPEMHPEIQREPEGRGRRTTGSHRNGSSPRDRRGPAPVLVVVDLTTGCTPLRRTELVEAAHGASRMGGVVLLVRGEDWPEVDVVLAEAAVRNGLGRAGVRCQVVDPKRRVVAVQHHAPSLVISDAAQSPATWSEPKEVLSLEAGLRRLRELGRSPAFNGPDPVFRPLPVR